jgi:glutathione S-transferase
MIKLYGAGPSRWVRPYWTLQELDVPFEPITLSLRNGDHRKLEYLAINPFGKVPALVDGDLTLFESAAICTYLADKYPDAGLSPRPGTSDRARHDQWVSFAISELEQPLWRIARHTFVYPESKRSPAEIELAKEDFRATATTLESLVVSEFLVGGRFTVADVMVGYALQWSKRAGLLTGLPRLAAYLETLVARPAFPAQFFG